MQYFRTVVGITLEPVVLGGPAGGPEETWTMFCSTFLVQSCTSP